MHLLKIMQLSLFSDYALRALIYLAVREEEDGPAEISGLAEAYGISRNHLVKVIHRLGQLGFIETRRGRSGGIRLILDPAEIRLGEVVRATEPRAPLLPCLSASAKPTDGPPDCRIKPICRLRGVLRDANEAFYASLDQKTLADVIEPRTALRALLLGVSPAGKSIVVF